MNLLHPMLAEEPSASEVLRMGGQALGDQFTEGWLVFGAFFVVIAAASIWGILYSKKKSRLRVRKHKHHRHEHGEEQHDRTEDRANSEEAVDDEDESEHVRRRKKRRRSSRPRRPLNPTLAETRGLPPLRNDSTPPPIP